MRGVAFTEAPVPIRRMTGRRRDGAHRDLDLGRLEPHTGSTATTALDTVHKAPVLTVGVTATFSEGQTGPRFSIRRLLAHRLRPDRERHGVGVRLREAATPCCSAR